MVSAVSCDDRRLEVGRVMAGPDLVGPLGEATEQSVHRGAARRRGPDGTQVVLPGRARCPGEHRRGDRRQLRIQLGRQRLTEPRIRSGCAAAMPARSGALRVPTARHAVHGRCPGRTADSTSRPATRRRPPAIAAPARTGRRAGHRRAPRCAVGRPAPGRRPDRLPRRCGPAASAAPDPAPPHPARRTRRACDRCPEPRPPRSGWWG